MININFFFKIFISLFSELKYFKNLLSKMRLINIYNERRKIKTN